MDFYSENLAVSGAGSYWDGTGIIFKKDIVAVPEDQKQRGGRGVTRGTGVRPNIPCGFACPESSEAKRDREEVAKKYGKIPSLISILVKVRSRVSLTLLESHTLVRAFRIANPEAAWCGNRSLDGILMDLDIGLIVDQNTAVSMADGLSKPVFRSMKQESSYV